MLGVLIGAGTLALAPLPASAQRITALQFFSTIDSTMSDRLSVFEAGPPGTPSGNIVGDDVTRENSIIHEATLREVDHTLSNPALAGDYALIYDSAGHLSDIVGVDSGAKFGYVSEIEGHPLNLADWVGAGKAFNGVKLATFTEAANGIIVDISALINPDVGGARNSAYFYSDGDTFGGTPPIDQVPDGGLTVALLGFALVGVEGLRRKLSK